MTGGRCCLCFAHGANEVHHLRYADERGVPFSLIYPRIENTGNRVDVVPLHKHKCHKYVHQSEHWHWDSADPTHGNRQKDSLCQQLTEAYRFLINS